MITGCAGLIGSHLCDALLRRGYRVIGIDNLSIGKYSNIEHNVKNPNFRFKLLDVSYPSDQLEKECEGSDNIVHLATEKKPYKHHSASRLLLKNVKAVETMLNMVKKNKAKFLFGSSSDVYGYAKTPMSEDDPVCLGPSNIKRWSYATSKLYGEHLAFSYYQDFEVPVVVLRYFGCFGERASTSWSGGHAMVFLDALVKNKEITVHGDGKQTRTMCYVGDIVDGTVEAVENPRAVGNIINLGGTEEMSIIDFVYCAKKVLNVDSPNIRLVPFSQVFGDYKEIPRRVPDLTKARQLLGFNVKVSVKEAIMRTASWLRKNENV